MIVPAYVTSTQYLGNRSIFIRQLDYQKLPYTISPVLESLQKTGVLAVMDSDFNLFVEAKKEHLLTCLHEEPNRLLVQQNEFELAKQYALVQLDVSLGQDSDPLNYTKMSGVSSQATLAEVYQLLQASRDGAVYVYEGSNDNISGIITWNKLRNYLHQGSY